MKTFVKDWWPLLLVAGWWLWKKRTEAAAEPAGKPTPKGTGYGHETDASGNFTEWWYDENGLYHIHTRLVNGVDIEAIEGERCEKDCYRCGSPRTYQKWRYPVPREGGAPYALRQACSNPDCQTHNLL